MRKLLLLITISLLTVSCASTNPYNITENKGAYLKNRKEQKGKATFIYTFSNGMTSDGKRSQFFEGNKAKNRVLYKIPSGEITLGLKILYFSEGGPVSSVGEALDISFKFLFSSEARSRLDATIPHEILVINPEESFSGLEGIKLNALEGYTYQINCKIEDGKAYIWIEDDSGKIVS